MHGVLLCYKNLIHFSFRSSLEQREREAIVHVKESMDIVETALMEKDQAQIREQQLNHEIARLKRAMETIVREAGERTSREVMAVREECNKSIDKMATEIHKLEEVGIQLPYTTVVIPDLSAMLDNYANNILDIMSI